MSYAHIDALTQRRPELLSCKADIEGFADILIACYRIGAKIMVCGNGGSASDAAHIVGELMKGFIKRRELPASDKGRLSRFGTDGAELAKNLQSALGAIDLTAFHALSTAIATDMNADYIYAQTLLGLGKQGDVFVGISTSGNARNIHLAAITAKAQGLKLVGLTGQNGGKMQEVGLYDVVVRVPEHETYRIQEEHIAIYHAVCLATEGDIFSENIEQQICRN